jgi:catechol 2,3-dioxygenase-like lactoylglutathione lyase family enzyme
MEEEKRVINALKAHVALNVRNVEESTGFYRRMLGLEPSKVRVGYAKFDVQNPPLNLTLNQSPFKERGALSHMGIQVASTDDVMAMRSRWMEAGLMTRDEMQTNCCYALQDKTWVHDPDGNEWEVFVVLEDNLAQTASCCGAVDAHEQSGAEASSSACSTETVAPASACCGTTDSTSAPVTILR